MNEFPPFDALEFLVGLRVMDVTVQPYAVAFDFDDGTRLVCEHLLEHRDPAGSCRELDIQKGLDPAALQAVVGCPIEGIAREPFLLTLSFADGQTVKVHAASGPYESGQIWHKGELQVF